MIYFSFEILKNEKCPKGNVIQVLRADTGFGVWYGGGWYGFWGV